jgi:hypothetical protein
MWTRRLIVALGLGACVTLGGCGAASNAGGPPEMTAEQKAEIQARDKATADAFKSFQKDQKKATHRQKGGQVVNGVRTS